MPREDKEVAAELLDVDRHVRYGLRPVDQHSGVVSLGHLRHFGDRQDRAEAVRRLGQRHQPRSRPQQGLILFEHDLAPVGHRE